MASRARSLKFRMFSSIIEAFLRLPNEYFEATGTGDAYRSDE